MSRDELELAFKKAVKAWDGEKRAALKKAKGTKGKKAKEEIAAIEAEYDEKLKQLQDSHQQKLKEIESNSIEAQKQTTAEGPPDEGYSIAPQVEGDADDSRERKQLKARRKKERQKEREAQRLAELELETANAGPSMRQVELEQLQAILTPLNLEIREVEADGHCLYRAVAAQSGLSYSEIRKYSQTIGPLQSAR